MSAFLNDLSQIPDCVTHHEGNSLKSWLVYLNQKVNEEQGVPSSDSSFTQDDFNYARTRPWGSELNHVPNFSVFNNRISAYIEQQLQTDECKRANCKGLFIERPEKGSICVEEPPPPPKPPRKAPARKLPKKPVEPKKPPVLDISKLKLPEKPWWSQEALAPLPYPNREPMQLAHITPDRFKMPSALPGLIEQINDPDGTIKKFVGTILGAAQASGKGINGNVVDVVFAIDHSESMEPVKSLVVQSVDQLIEELKRRGATKIRFGLVLFNDRDRDKTRISVMPLMEMNQTNRAALLHKLNNLKFRGGLEPVGLATQTALSLLEDKGHSRQVIVLTDADGLNDDNKYSHTFKDAKAQSQGVAVNVFNLGGTLPSKLSTQSKMGIVADSILPGAGMLIDPAGTLKRRYTPGSVPKGSFGRPTPQP